MAGQGRPLLLNPGCFPFSRAAALIASRFDGRIAQLVEQLTLNQRVHGSSPCTPTIKIKELRQQSASQNGI
jgi:hypothetical protein